MKISRLKKGTAQKALKIEKGRYWGIYSSMGANRRYYVVQVDSQNKVLSRINRKQYFFSKQDALHCILGVPITPSPVDKKRKVVYSYRQFVDKVKEASEKLNLSFPQSRIEARIWQVRKKLHNPDGFERYLIRMEKEGHIFFITHSKPSDLSGEEREGSIVRKPGAETGEPGRSLIGEEDFLFYLVWISPKAKKLP